AVQSDLVYDKSQCCGSTLFATKIDSSFNSSHVRSLFPLRIRWLFLPELLTPAERFRKRNIFRRRNIFRKRNISRKRNIWRRHWHSGDRGRLQSRLSRCVGRRRRGCFWISLNDAARTGTRSLACPWRGDKRRS